MIVVDANGHLHITDFVENPYISLSTSNQTVQTILYVFKRFIRKEIKFIGNLTSVLKLVNENM